MGYEVDSDKEKDIQEVIAEVGQIIGGIGGNEEETALSDPLEKAEEVEEEVKSSILTKNLYATSTEF